MTMMIQNHGLKFGSFRFIKRWIFILLSVQISFVLPSVSGELRYGWYVEPQSAEKILNSECAAYGINTINITSGWSMSESEIKVVLDTAALKGADVSIALTRENWTPDPSSKAEIETWVGCWKDHPAFYGYYGFDEPNYGENLWSSGTLHEWMSDQLSNGDTPGYYNIIHALDDKNPVWGVFSGDTVYSSWNDVSDAYALCNYYSGTWSREPDGYHFGNFLKNTVDDVRTGLNSGKEFIWVPQGFGNKDWPEYDDPQEYEIRYNTLTAVAAGVQRIYFWSWDYTSIQDTVRAVMTQMKDIKEQMGSIGQTNPSTISVTHPTQGDLIAKDLVVMRYGVAGKTAILLVSNIGGRESSDGLALTGVQFTLPANARPSVVTVMGENRTVPVTNGVFKDDFKRFEVHQYQFVVDSNPADGGEPMDGGSEDSGTENHDTDGALPDGDLGVAGNPKDGCNCSMKSFQGAGSWWLVLALLVMIRKLRNRLTGS